MHWHVLTLVDTIICLSSADMHGSAVPRMNHCTCVLSHANINRQNENHAVYFVSGGLGVGLVLMLKIFNVSKCKSMLISRKANVQS